MSESDFEMLEMAAKAAGLKVICRSGHYGLRVCDMEDEWNPLDDNCDAFWLAVHLGLHVVQATINGPQVLVMTDPMDNQDVCCVEDSSGDKFAATRRAIVRASAEIGRAMK